jgi:ArsR family transcriptional regulator
MSVNIDYDRWMVMLLPVTDVTAVADVTASGAVCCAPLVREPVSQTDAEQLAVTLKALADPARLRLLSIVASSEGKEACVCDLIEPVGLSQPTVSHHLKVLTEAGFLSRSKRGTWAYYRLQPDALAGVADFLAVQTSS